MPVVFCEVGGGRRKGKGFSPLLDKDNKATSCGRGLFLNPAYLLQHKTQVIQKTLLQQNFFLLSVFAN